MSSYFLQITIPTYNRAKILHETLYRFVDSIKLTPFNNKIRIVVLDNASTDNTKEICDIFRNECNLEYIVNKVNIGVERNIYKALTLNGAIWNWIFGDDDLIARDAIGKIYEQLAALDDNTKLALLNYGQISQNLDMQLSSKVCEVLPFWHGKWSGEQGLIDQKGIFDLLGFISSIIIRTDVAINAPDFTHFGSFYDHTASILSVTKLDSILTLPTGLMYQRQNNQRDGENQETGNGKKGFQTFILLVLLFNEIQRQNPQLDSNFFDRITSKLGINEPQGDVSYINSYIWFFEIFANRSLLTASSIIEKTRIKNSILSVIDLVHSANARNHILSRLKSL